MDIDFVGPLPADEGFDSVCTLMCHLKSEFIIVPVQSDITAEDFATVFFNCWYCKHGLPDEIVCDRDKLFVLNMWHTLLKLTRVKIKMSSFYRPESDGTNLIPH